MSSIYIFGTVKMKAKPVDLKSCRYSLKNQCEQNKERKTFS